MEEPEHLVVDTPFGEPSAPVTVGTIGNRRVAFLPRHGEHHQFPPHRINVRANLWALRSMGVRQVLATSAVGSLRADLGPGTFVVPDQVVDRTWGRAHTMYDGIGPVVHVSFANPYCPRGRAAALATGDPDMVDGGTLVVVNGPRFSSAAESQWHADQGWSIVGMTGQPEAALARELALCYTTIALVTDHDAGVQAGEAVTYAEVLQIFSTHVAKLSSLLHRLIPALPEAETDANATCVCRRALDGLALPFPLPGTTA
ncbi:MAG TPA: S-methyl-5'-thioadenosine phosphorylase [Propionibacteriaceae bacterium]|nr:S-methyl-5'-thioadenosine phosphorylase [Propionibacteriaceae bacterium]